MQNSERKIAIDYALCSVCQQNPSIFNASASSVGLIRIIPGVLLRSYSTCSSLCQALHQRRNDLHGIAPPVDGYFNRKEFLSIETERFDLKISDNASQPLLTPQTPSSKRADRLTFLCDEKTGKYSAADYVSGRIRCFGRIGCLNTLRCSFHLFDGRHF
jgi:hypothetical protein